MHQYKLISKKGEGTFSEVLMAEQQKTNQQFAIKCMKNVFATDEEVNNLREIQALKKLSPHEHIIRLHEILYDRPSGRLALVFELMDCNLYEHIKGRKQYLHPLKVKNIIYQLLKAIDHMHRNQIFHRDIKPENILLLGEHVKLADFGSCKRIHSEHPYTEYISTRWYRAPECLLTDGYYDSKMDMWGVGCVMFEIIGLFPLFPGNNELDQIHKIHNILGTPRQDILDRFKKHATHMEFNFPQQAGTGIEKLLPVTSKESIDLIKQLLAYDPQERITCAQALRHEYFKDLVESDQQMRQLQANQKSLQGNAAPKKSTGQQGIFDEKFSALGNENKGPSEEKIGVAKVQKKLSNTYNKQQLLYLQQQQLLQSQQLHQQQIIKKGHPTVHLAHPSAKKKESAYRGSSMHVQDGSTDEEGDKQFMFPPIKNTSIMDKSTSVKKPYEAPKKLYGGAIVKGNIFNQYLKKNKKGTQSPTQGDYILHGKKTGLLNGSFNNNNNNTSNGGTVSGNNNNNNTSLGGATNNLNNILKLNNQMFD